MRRERSCLKKIVARYLRVCWREVCQVDSLAKNFQKYLAYLTCRRVCATRLNKNRIGVKLAILDRRLQDLGSGSNKPGRVDRLRIRGIFLGAKRMFDPGAMITQQA